MKTFIFLFTLILIIYGCSPHLRVTNDIAMGCVEDYCLGVKDIEAVDSCLEDLGVSFEVSSYVEKYHYQFDPPLQRFSITRWDDGSIYIFRRFTHCRLDKTEQRFIEMLDTKYEPITFLPAGNITTERLWKIR